MFFDLSITKRVSKSLCCFTGACDDDNACNSCVESAYHSEEHVPGFIIFLFDNLFALSEQRFGFILEPHGRQFGWLINHEQVVIFVEDGDIQHGCVVVINDSGDTI